MGINNFNALGFIKYTVIKHFAICISLLNDFYNSNNKQILIKLVILKTIHII